MVPACHGGDAFQLPRIRVNTVSQSFQDDHGYRNAVGKKRYAADIYHRYPYVWTLEWGIPEPMRQPVPFAVQGEHFCFLVQNGRQNRT